MLAVQCALARQEQKEADCPGSEEGQGHPAGVTAGRGARKPARPTTGAVQGNLLCSHRSTRRETSISREAHSFRLVGPAVKKRGRARRSGIPDCQQQQEGNASGRQSR
eukprot:6172345-Pleurochrysis_carterae.AAC.2